MKNVKEYTRAQACKIIAGTSDMDLIKSFSAHENKHVKAYVEHKLNKLMNPEPVEEVESVEETVTQVEEVREEEKADTVLAEEVVAAVAEELEMIDMNNIVRLLNNIIQTTWYEEDRAKELSAYLKEIENFKPGTNLTENQMRAGQQLAVRHNRIARLQALSCPSVIIDSEITALKKEMEEFMNGKTELDLLVERFTKEGKKNPLASARASLAARAQAEKRRAAKAS